MDADSTAPKLPVELWDEILSFIPDSKTLNAFCLVTKASCELGRRYLFKKLTVYNSQLQVFAQFSSTSPHIFTHTRTLCISEVSEDDPDFFIDVDVLHTALSALPRLESFSFAGFALRTRHAMAFEQPVFRNLKHLDIEIEEPGYQLQSDEHADCPIAVLQRFLSMFCRVEEFIVRHLWNGKCRCVFDVPEDGPALLGPEYVLRVLEKHPSPPLDVEKLHLLNLPLCSFPEVLISHALREAPSLRSLVMNVMSLETSISQEDVLNRLGYCLRSIELGWGCWSDGGESHTALR